jgi:hypothetical protein
MPAVKLVPPSHDLHMARVDLDHSCPTQTYALQAVAGFTHEAWCRCLAHRLRDLPRFDHRSNPTITQVVGPEDW